MKLELKNATESIKFAAQKKLRTSMDCTKVKSGPRSEYHGSN